MIEQLSSHTSDISFSSGSDSLVSGFSGGNGNCTQSRTDLRHDFFDAVRGSAGLSLTSSDLTPIGTTTTTTTVAPETETSATPTATAMNVLAHPTWNCSAREWLFTQVDPAKQQQKKIGTTTTTTTTTTMTAPMQKKKNDMFFTKKGCVSSRPAWSAAPVRNRYQQHKFRSWPRPKLARYFVMTQKNAAELLQVTTKVLKTTCRKLEIPRWPYGMLQKIQRQSVELKEHQEACLNENSILMEKINVLPLYGDEGQRQALLRQIQVNQKQIDEISANQQYFEEEVKRLSYGALTLAQLKDPTYQELPRPDSPPIFIENESVKTQSSSQSPPLLPPHPPSSLQALHQRNFPSQQSDHVKLLPQQQQQQQQQRCVLPSFHQFVESIAHHHE